MPWVHVVSRHTVCTKVRRQPALVPARVCHTQASVCIRDRDSLHTRDLAMEVDVAGLQDPRFWAPMICVGTSTEGVGDNRNVTLHLIQTEPNGRMVAYGVRVLGSHVLRPPYEPLRQPPAAQSAEVDMPVATPHQPVVVPPPPSKPQAKARPAKSPEDHCHDSNRSIAS